MSGMPSTIPSWTPLSPVSDAAGPSCSAYTSPASASSAAFVSHTAPQSSEHTRAQRKRMPFEAYDILSSEYGTPPLSLIGVDTASRGLY